LITKNLPTQSQLQELLRLDSCTLANAIETFEVRLRNKGFTDSSVRCLFPDSPAAVGYAATARVRTSDPPMEGHSYYDRTDWWNYILSIPAPRIVVLEDIDAHPGLGALVGEVHANILSALGCVGVVTNGAVRSLSAARALGLQIFAGGVCVSHAYAHVFDFGASIAVGGMAVEPGDLLHGDAHGVQNVPLELAGKLPGAAERITRQKRRLVALCHSPGFSLEKLRGAVKDT
jgi:4-hydroxy-4-methyl-2-oxoglutarate aldolase